MKLIQIDHQPSRKQLNVFGILWLIFFGVVGWIVLSKSGSQLAVGTIWGFAVGVPVVGWLMPSFMRIAYLGMAYAAYPIGFVISHLILVVVYYLVLTPIGLGMKLIGYDPMAKQFDENADSYWIERNQEDSLKTYFRQF